MQLNQVRVVLKKLQNGKQAKSVFGAGMMGAGIAYSTAIKGIPVVLKDVSVENAEKGKAYSQKLLINVFHKVV
jgi:3-hydroxyacyl-CoA dehydrogenase